MRLETQNRSLLWFNWFYVQLHRYHSQKDAQHKVDGYSLSMPHSMLILLLFGLRIESKVWNDEVRLSSLSAMNILSHFRARILRKLSCPGHRIDDEEGQHFGGALMSESHEWHWSESGWKLCLINEHRHPEQTIFVIILFQTQWCRFSGDSERYGK